MKEKRIASPIYYAAKHGTVINILIVGAGGTGSHLMHRMGAINQQLQLMVDRQLVVTVCDDDIVELHNCGRQLFDRHTDIGMAKAKCLAEGVNATYGTSFVGVPRRFDMELYHTVGPDLVVLAVDSVKSRKDILHKINLSNTSVMDIGNGDSYGQVMLYSADRGNNPRYEYSKGADLLKLYSNMEDPKVIESCSALESLTRQNALINATMAIVAANWISQLLYNPETEYEAIYVNNQNLMVNPAYIS